MKKTSKRNSEILKEWNLGERNMSEIAEAFGVSRNTVAGVLKRARGNGLFVLIVDSHERGSRVQSAIRKRMGEGAYLAMMRESVARASTFRRPAQAAP